MTPDRTLLSILVIVLSQVELTKGICGNEWEQYSDKKFCYKFFKEKKTWNEAKEECVKLNSTLAMPKTQQQHDDLKFFLLEYDSDVWMGLSDINVEGKPEWLDGAELGSWDVISSDGGDCFSVYSGYNWEAEGCDGLNPFLCQRDACGTDEFMCRNGNCIMARTRCDGAEDCADGSDEGDDCLCRRDWIVDVDRGVCYKLFYDKRNWEDSNEDCFQRGGNLATHKTENDFFSSLGNQFDFWIGLYGNVENSTFVWIDGQKLSQGDWTSWLHNQDSHPSDYSHCVGVYEGEWYAHPCGKKGSRICQVNVCDAQKLCNGKCIETEENCIEEGGGADGTKENSNCQLSWDSWGSWSACRPCLQNVNSPMTRTRTCDGGSTNCTCLTTADGNEIYDTENGTCSDVCPVWRGGRTKMFNCNRPGQTCNNNFTCNAATGECTCDANLYDYNCNNQLKDNTECTPACLPGLSSYCAAPTTDGSDARCHCNSDRHLEIDGTCRQNVRHVCFREEFKIDVVFPSFEGKAYIRAPQETCDVTMVNASLGQMEGLFNYTDCATTQTTGVFDIELVLQFSQHYLTHSDLLFQMKCTVKSSGAVIASGNYLSNIIPAQDGHTRLEDYTTEIVIVTAYEKDSDDLIDKAHDFRDPFYLKFEAMDKNYTKISLQNCVATDEDRVIEFEFLKDGCPVEEARGLVWMLPTRNYRNNNKDNINYIGLNSFKVAQSSYSLFIRCSLELCTSEAGDSACKMTEICGKRKRTRRSAKDLESTRIVDVETIIIFKEESVGDEEDYKSDEDGFNRSVYIGVISVLAVLFVLMCAAIAYLACKKKARMRKCKTSKDDEAPSLFSIYLPRATGSKY